MWIYFIPDSRKTCSNKRGRPKKSQANSQSNIDSTASLASNPASPVSKKRGRPKKSQPNIASDASPATDFSSPSTDVKGKDKGEKIRTRTSPKVLHNLMKNLTEGQIKDLIDMGFGSLHKMAAEDLPGRIGLFVVDNYVPEKDVIKCKNYDIQIFPDLIHEMLSVPIGGLDIDNLVKIKKTKDSLSEGWYKNFTKRTPTASEVAKYVRESKVEGSMFKLSILVLFSNVMGLAGGGGLCRPQQILDYITEESQIEKIDWCKYVFKCMKESKKNWEKDNVKSHYTGPLLALIVSVNFDSLLFFYHSIHKWKFYVY